MAYNDKTKQEILSGIEWVREALYEAKNSPSDMGGKLDRALSRLKEVHKKYWS